jgi:hypothetical protein
MAQTSAITPPPQKSISRESMERFAALGSGMVIGHAIAAAYTDSVLCQDNDFMEWLVKPGSRALMQMDALGILKFDRETNTILSPEPERES